MGQLPEVSSGWPDQTEAGSTLPMFASDKISRLAPSVVSLPKMTNPDKSGVIYRRFALFDSPKIG